MSDTPPSDSNYSQRLSLILGLHQSPTTLVLATTGGGSFAISDLFSVPGASKTVLAAFVPYAPAAIARFIARAPEQYCCVRTARQLAMSAFQRGQSLLGAARKGETVPSEVAHYAEYDDSQGAIAPCSPFQYRLAERIDLADSVGLIGVGCTASLSTDREKRGDCRVHIATQTLRRTTTCSLQLAKGARTRWEEERLVADLIFNMIFDAGKDVPSGVGAEESVPFLAGTSKDVAIEEILPLGLKDGEKVLARRTVASAPLIDLFFGKTLAVLWEDGTLRHRRLELEEPDSQGSVYNSQAEFTQAIFPGSFNPIHEAHCRMVNMAQQRLGSRVALEIAVQSVDKPLVDYIDLEDRLGNIRASLPGQAVWLSQAKMFEEKADLFKETMFVVGADTLRRFADLRFYRGSIHTLHDVLRMIAYRNCRFLVFARQDENGLESMQTLQIPDMLWSLCDEVSADEFAMVLSSSEIRERENEFPHPCPLDDG